MSITCHPSGPWCCLHYASCQQFCLMCIWGWRSLYFTIFWCDCRACRDMIGIFLIWKSSESEMTSRWSSSSDTCSSSMIKAEFQSLQGCQLFTSAAYFVKLWQRNISYVAAECNVGRTALQIIFICFAPECSLSVGGVCPWEQKSFLSKVITPPAFLFFTHRVSRSIIMCICVNGLVLL